MKQKGFTLIELLAVIVILAIIALIATPMILGVIESGKKGAFESSARGIIKVAEEDFVQGQLTNSNLSYPHYYYLNESELEYKGKKFVSGIVLVEKDETTLLQATDGVYCANGTLENLTVTKGACDSRLPLVYYQGLEFTDNTWDNNFYSVEQQVDVFGSIEDFSNTWFRVKNNRLELEIPDVIPQTIQVDYGQYMQYAISFTTPSFEKEYTFQMDYEVNQRAFSITDWSYLIVLLDDLSNEANISNVRQSYAVNETSKGTIHFTRSLKANTKYYLMISGPVSIDNVSFSGITLKGNNPLYFSMEETNYYDTYEDPGTNAFDQNGVPVTNLSNGVKIKGTEDAFYYRQFFQTNRGIKSIERTIQRDYSEYFEFLPCSTRSKYIRQIKELPPEYQVEIYGGCSSFEWLPMEVDPTYPNALSEQSRIYLIEGDFVERNSSSPMACYFSYWKLRIRKNDSIVLEEQIDDFYNNGNVSEQKDSICS